MKRLDRLNDVLGKHAALSTWKVFLWVSTPLLILDQITKIAILNHFPRPTYPGEEIQVIPGFFNIVRVHNTGMAFGIGNNMEHSNILFLGIATAAVTFITILWRKNSFPSAVPKIAVASLMAGVFGNVIDRVRIGYVVDFLDFHIGNNHWPSFNVADSCIFVAAGLLIWVSFAADEVPAESKASADRAKPPSER